jgi:CheY-like chemotaxis protein
MSGVFGQRRKKLVVVAERDRKTLNFIDKLLLKFNRHCEVVRIPDGADAFASVCNRQPDLVIASPSLDGVNGFRLVDNLKLDPQTRRIPVVLTTALNRAVILTTLLTTYSDEFSKGALG